MRLIMLFLCVLIASCSDSVSRANAANGDSVSSQQAVCVAFSNANAYGRWEKVYFDDAMINYIAVLGIDGELSTNTGAYKIYCKDSLGAEYESDPVTMLKNGWRLQSIDDYLGVFVR